MPSVAHFYSQDGHSHSHNPTAAASRDLSGGSMVSVDLVSEDAEEEEGEEEDALEEIDNTRRASNAGVREKAVATPAQGRKTVASAGSLAHMEAKRDKRFRFFNDER